mmetsp:Transcript_21232/g.25549  ORF Transcript_21232/g.25549 Transcript_21232/m.25549 type:complete len:107 (+) Transcript_21232:1990-2310(+)
MPVPGRGPAAVARPLALGGLTPARLGGGWTPLNAVDGGTPEPPYAVPGGACMPPPRLGVEGLGGACTACIPAGTAIPPEARAEDREAGRSTGFILLQTAAGLNYKL